MDIVLLCVGKTDVAWVKEGLDLYRSRLVHYAPFQLVEIPQLKKAGALSREEIKRKEGELILGKLSPQDRLVLLDEKGRQFRSVDFARWLGGRLQQGSGALVFAVGGAYGFSPEVYARAESQIALSEMTFSHQMVRTIFAEQLYRAFTILSGEPYHNE